MRHDHDPEVAAAQQLTRLARTNPETRRLLGETLVEPDEPRIDSGISDSPDFYLSDDEPVQAAVEDILALIEAELGEKYFFIDLIYFRRSRVRAVGTVQITLLLPK